MCAITFLIYIYIYIYLNKICSHLQQAAACLTDLDQSQSASTLESMKPFFGAIVKPELLKHQDSDIKLLVATSKGTFHLLLLWLSDNIIINLGCLIIHKFQYKQSLSFYFQPNMKRNLVRNIVSYILIIVRSFCRTFFS